VSDRTLIKNKPEHLTAAEFALQVAVRQSYAEIPDVDWSTFTTLSAEGYPTGGIDPSSDSIEAAIHETEGARAAFVQERVAELLSMWAEAAA
jgi:hypothetical protein